MTKIDMAKLPGLSLRGSVYQLRVVIPLDLRPAYNRRTQLVQPLGTGEHREATLKGTQARAARLEEFDRRRLQLRPQRLVSVSAELAAELAGRVKATRTVQRPSEGQPRATKLQ